MQKREMKWDQLLKKAFQIFDIGKSITLNSTRLLFGFELS